MVRIFKDQFFYSFEVSDAQGVVIKETGFNTPGDAQMRLSRLAAATSESFKNIKIEE